MNFAIIILPKNVCSKIASTLKKITVLLNPSYGWKIFVNFEKSFLKIINYSKQLLFIVLVTCNFIDLNST